MVYIVMGVSGCGKTTVGKALARELGLEFYDADDYHSRESIDKMKNSIALDDSDRVPWLLGLAARIKQWSKGMGAVLACSALKASYRRILSDAGEAKPVFIYLKGEKDLFAKRLAERNGHFFSAKLLDSQLAILEEPRDAFAVEAAKPLKKICAEIIDGLSLRKIYE